ncbi:kinase-like domain-containing protein [Aspergillus granulosus]|uniref:Kinase-like domain-containing protein n=1 Tax=Aspergillus granulosus TaxID=176169 RepID=A0ABR4HG34_9EURO
MLQAARPPRCLSVRRRALAPFLPRTASRSATWQVMNTILSDSGTNYKLNELLTDPLGKTPPIYRAGADGSNYLVKTGLYSDEFDYQLVLRDQLTSSQNIRTVTDSAGHSRALFYPYFYNNLWARSLSPEDTRGVLRDALCGLADLHDNGVMHNGLTPYSILFEYDDTGTHEAGNIKKAQLGNLEYTIKLAPNEWFVGPPLGKNPCYRSPEAWCEARQNQASDVFSFGMVIVHAMNKDISRHRPFRVKFTRHLNQGEIWKRTLTRQVACCSDHESFEGFLEHIGEGNRFRMGLMAIKGKVQRGYPRTPFMKWNSLDKDVADLVSKMTNLDPRRRITAREALEHEWFTGKRGS